MHLAAVARLHDERDLGAGLLPDEVLVHHRGQQQRRDRGQIAGRVPVGQDQDAGTVLNGLRNAAADLDQAVLQPAPPSATR